MDGNQFESIHGSEKVSLITESQDLRSMERYILTGHSIFIPKFEMTVGVMEHLMEVVQEEAETEEEVDPPKPSEDEEDNGSPSEEGEKEAEV